jgi:hypothetical protein
MTMKLTGLFVAVFAALCTLAPSATAIAGDTSAYDKAAIADTMRSTNSAAVSNRGAEIAYQDLKETSALTGVPLSDLVTGYVRLKTAFGGTNSDACARVRAAAKVSMTKRIDFLAFVKYLTRNKVCIGC